MGFENGKHSSRNNQQTRDPAPVMQRTVAPGKRTRTAGLERQTAGTPVRAQMKRDPAAEAAREAKAASTQQWLDIAIRPDLHAEPVQRQSAGAEHDPASSQPSRSGGSGQPMPEGVRAKMEESFGTDFSAVRVHEGPSAAAMGALAYAQGTDIHFTPGQYQPESRRGQELLGHELTHVVQQSQGRVQPTMQAKGVGINADAGLEREADEMGARAARGERASGATPASGERLDAPGGLQPAIQRSTGIVQRYGDGDKKKGEDYCNNIGKTIGRIEDLLPGFLDDAIRDAIAVINANRHKCSVSTNLVKGPDTNTEEYGQCVQGLMQLVQQASFLQGESDKKYFRSTAQELGRGLRPLIDSIPEAAVDERVAAVINAGLEGDAQALAAINDALARLRDALKARFQSYMMELFTTMKKPGKGPDPDDGGAGGASQSIATH